MTRISLTSVSGGRRYHATGGRPAWAFMQLPENAFQQVGSGETNPLCNPEDAFDFRFARNDACRWQGKRLFDGEGGCRWKRASPRPNNPALSLATVLSLQRPLLLVYERTGFPAASLLSPAIRMWFSSREPHAADPKAATLDRKSGEETRDLRCAIVCPTFDRANNLHQ